MQLEEAKSLNQFDQRQLPKDWTEDSIQGVDDLQIDAGVGIIQTARNFTTEEEMSQDEQKYMDDSDDQDDALG